MNDIEKKKQHEKRRSGLKHVRRRAGETKNKKDVSLLLSFIFPLVSLYSTGLSPETKTSEVGPLVLRCLPSRFRDILASFK